MGGAHDGRMGRTALFLESPLSRTLPLVALAACAPLSSERTDAFVSEAHLERADLLAREYQLPDLGRVRHQVTNDQEAFLFLEDRSWSSCDDTIAVFRLADLEQGLREPSQIIECPEHLTDAEVRFNTSLDVHGDLLAAGPFLYRRVGDRWQFEAELGGLTPAHAVRTVLLGETRAVTEVGDAHYFYEKIGDTWTHYQRLQDGLNFGYSRADGDILHTNAFGSAVGLVYAPDASGRYRQIQEDLWVWETHNGHVIDYAEQIRRWDGQAYVPAGLDLQAPEGIRLDMSDFRRSLFTDERITVLGERATVVYDAQTGDLIGYNDETVLPRAPRGARGTTSYISEDRRWVHLIDPVLEPFDPDLSFTQTHDLTVEAGEIVSFTFEMPYTMENLQVDMNGTGDADLYVRFGEAPHPSAFDCAPYLPGSEESCWISDPDRFLTDADIPQGGTGTWYVQVVGFDALSEVQVVIEAVDLED